MWKIRLMLRPETSPTLFSFLCVIGVFFFRRLFLFCFRFSISFYYTRVSTSPLCNLWRHRESLAENLWENLNIFLCKTISEKSEMNCRKSPAVMVIFNLTPFSYSLNSLGLLSLQNFFSLRWFFYFTISLLPSARTRPFKPFGCVQLWKLSKWKVKNDHENAFWQLIE